MASLDELTVRHVAHLARLRITDAEAALYASQLSKVLEHVGQLNEVNTQHIPPTAHPLPIANVFRDDRLRPLWTQEQALNNAPHPHDGFFRVPKVLDQESP